MYGANMSTKELHEQLLDNMCRLADMYVDDGDIDEALRWLNLAADLGSEEANFKIGELYYYGESIYGEGVTKDLAKAAEYFEKSGDWMANGGIDEISYNFGDMYRYGKGVEKNIEKAIFWYEAQLFGKDWRDAQFALAEIYRDGEGGIQPDIEKAVKYLIELAFDSGGYFFVTNTELYGDGQDVPMSYEEEKYFSGFDTSNGDDKARFELGRMYLYGLGVKRDVSKAAWWFAKTDELYGYESGEVFELAECYRKGDSVERDIDKAVAWYKKIVEYSSGRYDEASFALAEIYSNGDGVERDIDEGQ